MRYLLAAFLLLMGGGATVIRPCPFPTWTVDLSEMHFEDFGFSKVPPDFWTRQRGVVFLSTERLAVYQVLDSGPLSHLAKRDKSGGTGRFTLQVAILRIQDGMKIKELRVDTSSGTSGVFPTREGRFLIRAGDLLLAYSAEYEQIASITLHHSQEASLEIWRLSVAPDGEQIYAEHQEDFGFGKGRRRTGYLINPDTLQVISKHNPEEPPWASPYSVTGTDKKRVVESADGELLFTASLSGRDRFGPSELAGSLFVALIYRTRADPLDIGRCSRPTRLAVYDIATQEEKCSVPISQAAGSCGSGLLYAVAQNGSLAIVEGKTLRLYRP